ncbi:hypothetical protein N9934_03595, partial [Desulfosarcina sp.]|nr:hypothetical protein [Desulfosarcina sp.]
MEVDYSFSDSEVIIGLEDITITYFGKLVVEEQEQTNEASKVITKTNSRMYDFIEVSNLVAKNYATKEGICVTCDIDLSDEYQVLVNYRDRFGDYYVTLIDDYKISLDYHERERFVFMLEGHNE